MDDHTYLILTLLYGQDIYLYSLKVKNDKLPEGCIEFYKEPENKAFFKSLLPSYLIDDHTIVTVTEIHGHIDVPN
tara:strand:- start:5755 stop:5979 length:225 start_codon:yes stop_codon:yes gene_type:complete